MQLPQARASGTRIGAALLLALFLGVGVGVAVAVFAPQQAVSTEARAHAALLEDSAGGLERAAALAVGPDLGHIALLAHTLLLVDHGGGAFERRRADEVLKTSGQAKNAPAALYARALLSMLEGGEDPRLDDTIAQTTLDADGFVALARGVRALARHRLDDARNAFEVAALRPGALAQASLMLARTALLSDDVRSARAHLDRLWRTHPDHAPSRALAVAVEVTEDARKEPDRERALKRTPAEDAALARLEGLDARDGAVLAAALWLVAAARNDDVLAQSLRARVLQAAARHAAIAAIGAEVALLEGDMSSAEEFVAAAAGAGSEPLLAGARARLRALELVPEAERSKRARQRGLSAEGLHLPFGDALLDVEARPLPLRHVFGPEVPDALISVTVANAGENLANELELVNAAHAIDTALGRGDLGVAMEMLTRAREQAPGNVTLAVLEARIRARQADTEGVRGALNLALGQAADTPENLVAAMRAAAAAGEQGLVRRALVKLKATGFLSPAAIATEAILASRAGDKKAAAALAARAAEVSPDDADVQRALLITRRDAGDLDAVRKAADALLALSRQTDADPVVRAWLAEALLRRGEGPRAQGIADEVLGLQPELADAWLVRGLALKPFDPLSAAAAFKKVIALAPQSALAAEAGEAPGQPPKDGPKDGPKPDRKLPRKAPPTPPTEGGAAP